jgi:hypothetical protein
MQLALTEELDGALLDVNLGGCQIFPLARLLRSKSVPFIFVSSYDRSVLPEDLKRAPLISKPILVSELTRAAATGFPEKAVAPAPASPASRLDALRSRIETGERRLTRQRRRLERLQFEGHDPYSLQIAADLLEQMNISVELLKDTLRAIEQQHRTPAGFAIRRPISDDMIDTADVRSVAQWADRFNVTQAKLLELANLHGASARLIERALGQEKMTGPCRKSGTLD